MTLRELLALAVTKGASDLHVTAGAPPTLRIAGQLHPLLLSAVSVVDTNGMIEGILSPRQQHDLDERGEVDFALTLPEIGRFRICVFRQRAGAISVAARVLSQTPPPLEALSLPPALTTLVLRESGLIVITGPTGSGKSTTLAALLDYVNRHTRRRIITLEDPIEYLHEHVHCLIDQREVGTDTASFALGLRAALRQDPDVLMIGELRDQETMATALTAAETGHLVLATMHTGDAVQAIDRLVDAFAPSDRQPTRSQLAGVLTAVIAQSLVLGADDKTLTLLAEVLVNTSAIANLIRLDQGSQIRSAMQTGRSYGMQTMEMAYRDAVMAGRIRDSTAG
ncbi:MAG: PilT/PilU family type 4a pilus ATPase [Firmicutes bacterium]|nr:PilT/PilU family type 4a pilus ATPase [Bacillota bacterium]